MKKLFHEPIILFLLIGGALLGLSAWIGRSTDPMSKRIVVTPDQVAQLADQFSRTWMRPPTEAELDGLIKSHVREEVYYREALSLGLDENDQVIRRRLRQKLEFVLDDMSAVNVPSDQVLTAFLQENADKFRLEPRISFHQVYLNPDKRSTLETDAERILDRLQAGVRPKNVGDPTLVGYEFDRVTQSEVERQFGSAFAREVMALEPGVWTGPLYSSFGGHLVMVTEREDGRMPELNEIRADVEREWLALRRAEFKDAAYRGLLEGYEVIIERTEGEE